MPYQDLDDEIAGGNVASFNGRTGAVVPAVDDYAQADITGLKTTDSPTFANITSTNAPTNPTHVANKDYVDSLIQGLDWQTSVKDEIDFTTSEPGSPTVTDRYINTVTGVSSGTTQSVTANYIYEWNGTDWTESIPDEGFAVWIEDTNELKVYNGSAWVTFGSVVYDQSLNTTDNVAFAGLTVNSDADGTSILGRAKIGSISGDDACFGHFDRFSIDQAAVRQDQSGNVTFTMRTSKLMCFKQANNIMGCWTAQNRLYIGTTGDTTNEGDILLNKDGVLSMKETTTPTADVNYGKVYTKNDNKLYFQDGAGVEHEIAFV